MNNLITIQDYISYYGDVFGPIRYNEAYPSYDVFTSIDCDY